MRILLASLLLGISLALPPADPFGDDTDVAVDMIVTFPPSTPIAIEESTVEGISTVTSAAPRVPEISEHEMEPEPAEEEEMVPEPEPAIKFDNIESEDYGEIEEEKNAKPAPLNDDAITKLVDQFLNPDEPSNETRVFNQAVHDLVGRNSYWKTSDVKAAGSIKNETQAKEWLEGYQEEAQEILHEVAKAGWQYVTAASPSSKQSLDEAEAALSKFVKSTSMQAKQFDQAGFKDKTLKKLLSVVTFEGMSALDADSAAQFATNSAQLNHLTTDIQICDKEPGMACVLRKDDLKHIFETEKDASRLSTIWTNYITSIAAGKVSYANIMSLSNKGAKLNGFPDSGALWRSAFDLSSKTSKPVIDLRQQLADIYKQIEPFYHQLHAYMRRQIAGLYQNPAGLTKDGPIPAQLFGSVDGGDWSAHYKQTKPFDEEDTVAEDMLSAFRAQNYTEKHLFIKAYRYMKSIGFPHLPGTFWNTSLFKRTWSSEMICEPAAAIDLRDGEDYRVKACLSLNEADFQLAHSLMAQVYYQYLYREQPLLFREAASSTISDAIAKTFALLAMNPDYLYAQKLVPASHLDIKDTSIINRLYREALTSFAKIPFAIVEDEWRYELFEGKTTVDKGNDRWWQLRTKYEGVRAPQPYNSSNLDALMHTSIVQTNSPAVRDIISYVAQFQILKSICPEGAILSEGCILSEDTTEKIKETMALGSSITWLKALEMITGKAQLDPKPMLEYFEPLINWLNNINEIDQVNVGWDGEGTPFGPEEIPKLRAAGTVEEHVDQVAIPGQDCTHGQECILQSYCNGTVCVCNEGLFSFEFGGTLSCVAGAPPQWASKNPTGDGFDIFEAPTTSTSQPVATTRSHRRKGAATFSVLSTTIFALIFGVFLLF